jgi:methylmalonyl-CoA/ethylmalonyl-CoA epimerase
MIAKRLDHLHLGVNRLAEWAPLFGDLFGLEVIRGVDARTEAEPQGPPGGMIVAEYQIGDGFIALLQPVDDQGQIARFLARRGEGFYALSFDVGDLNQAAEVLGQRGLPVLDGRNPDGTGAEDGGFIWTSPKLTGGTAIQLTWPWPMDPGANPNMVGIPATVVAVADLDQAVSIYRQLLDLEEGERVKNDRFGYEGAVLAIGESKDTLILACPSDDEKPLARHVAHKGPSIFQFTIEVKDLAAEVERIRSKDVGVEADPGGQLAWIDPEPFHGIRIELRQDG